MVIVYDITYVGCSELSPHLFKCNPSISLPVLEKIPSQNSAYISWLLLRAQPIIGSSFDIQTIQSDLYKAQ